MPRERLSMRKIKEVLRLNQTGLSNRAIARACAIGKETVREYLRRAAEAGLGWPLPEGLTTGKKLGQLLHQMLSPQPDLVGMDAELTWRSGRLSSPPWPPQKPLWP